MSRTRNSKFGSSYFFISRGSRGEASSFTATCCSALPRTTVSFTVLPILYCRTIVANRSSSDGCDASTGSSSIFVTMSPTRSPAADAESPITRVMRTPLRPARPSFSASGCVRT